MSNVAIIGFGNVGYHFSATLSQKHSVTVFGRTSDGNLIQDLKSLDPSAFDFLIITVPDGSVKKVSESIEKSDCVVLHTSGSRAITDLSKHSRSGVIYPLQTFSKEKKVDFSSFPIFIEATDDLSESLFSFVRTFSKDVRFMNSANRRKLHLAAVFACNFTNHMYNISDKILGELGLTFSDMEHLAQETLQNAITLSPEKAQTGPAKRNDQETLAAHLQMISNQNWINIYELISHDIRMSQS